MAGRHTHGLANSTIATASPSPTLVGQDEAKAAPILDVFCPPDPRPAVAAAFGN